MTRPAERRPLVDFDSIQLSTLKEQCIYLHQFRSLEEARQVIAAFIARYNTQWLIERLGHRTPAQARADARRKAA